MHPEVPSKYGCSAHYCVLVVLQIFYGPISELLSVDFGAPLHSMVVLGNLHELELEYLAAFAVTADTPRLPAAAAASESSDSEPDA